MKLCFRKVSKSKNEFIIGYDPLTKDLNPKCQNEKNTIENESLKCAHNSKTIGANYFCNMF